MKKVIQMSQRQISENGEEKSMSLQEVFLVNHSLSQAKEKERMITVTSGLICSGPYMRSGPIGSLVRTLLASSRWYSPARRLKWEVSPLFGESEPVFKRRQQYVVETICRDLEREGYSVQPVLIPACAVGAPHRRDRVWFIAHRDSPGLQAQGTEQPPAGIAGDDP